ncbi:hypothetical protein [Rhodococcus pyridinivorans]|uniref:hypothetical protein n=1 Tax=Rhodococcus pyridinivorans TaxID=103816 RepID=UPI000BA24B1F|nr:hypothetical protein [Rhodococcus pyridinivorans]
MPTALQVADGLGGWAGPATLYRVDPPLEGKDHLLLFHQPPMYGQVGQMVVLLADEDAQVKDSRPTHGTHATNDPNHPFTLQMAGGYRLIQSVDEMGA